MTNLEGKLEQLVSEATEATVDITQKPSSGFGLIMKVYAGVSALVLLAVALEPIVKPECSNGFCWS